MFELVRQRARYMVEEEAAPPLRSRSTKAVAVIAATALVLQIAELLYHLMLE